MDVDLRLAGRRQKSPAWTQLIQPGAVIDVAGLGINDLLPLDARAARILLSPLRGLGHAFVIHFALARLVDEREVGGGRLTQCCGSRGEIRGRRAAAGCASGSSGSESRRATRVPAQASAGQTEPAINLVLEEVCADNSVGGHAALRVPDQPERLDVFFADLLDDEVDDVL